MDWSVPATDPRKFNDPVALEVKWDTISTEGSNIRDRRLEQASPGQMKFELTGSAIQFCAGFTALGLIFVGLSFYGLISGKSSLDILMIPGILSAVLGGFFYYSLSTPIIFDTISGFFWKGRGRQVVIALNQIHALQLITKRILTRTTPTSGSNYLTYELNLVLKDRTRINVICHGDIASSKADANTLAKFLSVRLWDAAKTETECLPPGAPALFRTIARAVDDVSE